MSSAAVLADRTLCRKEMLRGKLDAEEIASSLAFVSLLSSVVTSMPATATATSKSL